MPTGEARTLLRTVLGPRTATADELDLIAARCGRLPLALRVAGHLPRPEPADEHRDIPRSPRRREEAAAPPERSRTMRASTSTPRSPERAAAGRRKAGTRSALAVARGLSRRASMPRPPRRSCEVEADDAPRDLGELRRRSMVLFDDADRRWRLHDLMRDVARVPLEGRTSAALEAGLEAARARHARHYCGVLATANDLYLKGGERVLAGLALYDLEQRNIAAGQAWAAAHIEQGRCRGASRGRLCQRWRLRPGAPPASARADRLAGGPAESLRPPR